MLNSLRTRIDTFKAVARNVHYIQGQSPKSNIREYFYYIDHHGQLFLDDARMKNFTSCFKEKQFLEFFFKRIKLNDTDRYAEDFPYLSLCGRERNFVRCDDQAIVYTHVLPSSNPGEPDRLSYGGAGELLTVPFTPEKICMLPWTGRIYHPAVERTGGVGLIKSSLAIELSKNFEFGPEGEYAPPTHFTWKDKRFTLTNELVDKVKKTDTEFLK